MHCRIRTASSAPSLVAAHAQRRSGDLHRRRLEIGWLPVLLQTAGNQKVQPGQAGFIAAAEFVDKLKSRLGWIARMGMCIRRQSAYPARSA